MAEDNAGGLGHGKRIEAPSVSRFLELATLDRGVPRVRSQVRPETTKERARILGLFGAWVRTARVDAGGQWVEFGDGPAHHVTVFVLDQYVRHLLDGGAGPSTIDKHLQVIRRAWNYGVQACILPPGTQNPVPRATRRRTLAERQELLEGRSFSDFEIAEILRACRQGYRVPTVAQRGEQRYRLTQRCVPEPYLAAAVEVALETGLRSGELRELRWDAVDFARGLLRVRHDSSKSGARLVPLSNRALEVLRGLARVSPYVLANRRAKPLGRWALSHAMRHLLRAIGIKGKSFHGLRHSFAQRAASRGMPAHRLRDVLGHSSLEVTQVYLQCDMARWADEFRRLMAPPGPAGPAGPPSLPKEAGDGRG